MTGSGRKFIYITYTQMQNYSTIKKKHKFLNTNKEEIHKNKTAMDGKYFSIKVN